MYIGLNQQSFPVVTDLELFKAGVGDKTEIRFMEQDNGTTIVSYIVSDETTFDNAYALECRGITFGKDGKIISRNLHKFFNVNEKPHTQVNLIDWNKVSRVMQKRDGSMLCVVDHPSNLGNFSLKSKKSFTSDVAISATKWMSDKHNYLDFCTSMTDLGMTAIFEWTSPTARIVISYDQDMLTLLHVRDNLTGRYLSQNELSRLSEKYDIPLVENVDDIHALVLKDPKLVQELADTVEGIEGWVFQFENGDMVKWKTKQYCELHRSMPFLRERDIVEMVLNETVDDLKALLAGQSVNVAEIIEIENRVVKDLDSIIYWVNDIIEANKDLDRKTIALKFGNQGLNHPYFGLIMQKYSGKEPDYLGYYKKEYLSSVPLRQLNLMQSTAEIE
jgi:RNA ligase